MLPLVKNISLFLDDKPSVYALRQKAKQALLLTGFPDKKNEAWKYTNIQPILNTNYELDTSDHHCGHDCCHSSNTDSPTIDIKFCQGKLHIEEIDTPNGLNITPLPLALYENEYKSYILGSFDLEKNPFASLNTLYLEQGICIHLEKNTEITKPIFINYNQSYCEQIQTPIHNIIILEKNAKLDLIESFISSKQNDYFMNCVNEIYLKEGAVLTHYKQQKNSPNAYYISLNSAKIFSKANYKQYHLSNGGKISREETHIDLLQPNANAEIYSAYIAKKDSINDITTKIYHSAEKTTSNQYIKGILEEESTAVFQGKINISHNADKCTGNQLHKALYLNQNATLNCKPELEIFAEDVKCSHGASCGEINKDQLFYLTSRGIDHKTALEMLTTAHLEEILNLIENKTIKDLITL